MKYIFPIILSLFLVGCSYHNPSIKKIDDKKRVEGRGGSYRDFTANFYNLLAMDIKQDFSFKEILQKELEVLTPVATIEDNSSFSFSNNLEVTATAYNSLKAQTDSTPNLGAWGDKIEPGMKIIAVSRDLLELGLKYNTKVKIRGLDGYFVVKDKMAKKWRRKIDIYMGKDRKKALKWGKRVVEIMW